MHGTGSHPSSNTCTRSQSQLVPASAALITLSDDNLSPFILLPHSLTPGAEDPEKYLFGWISEHLASARHGGGEKRSARMKRKRGSHHLDQAFTAAIGRPTKSYLILFIFMNLSYHVNQPALRVPISNFFMNTTKRNPAHKPLSVFLVLQYIISLIDKIQLIILNTSYKNRFLLPPNYLLSALQKLPRPED